MANKPTALDILFQEIKESKSFLPDNLFDYLEMVYNKAKEIEKEQIIDAHNKGIWPEPKVFDDGEEYYNETFKQQDNGK
jgi:predicted thioredoxin/glutaredoxin